MEIVLRMETTSTAAAQLSTLVKLANYVNHEFAIKSKNIEKILRNISSNRSESMCKQSLFKWRQLLGNKH